MFFLRKRKPDPELLKMIEELIEEVADLRLELEHFQDDQKELEIDYDDLGREIDYDALAREFNYHDISKDLDYSQVEVDVSEVAEVLSEEIIDEVVEKVVENLPMRELAEAIFEMRRTKRFIRRNGGRL